MKIFFCLLILIFTSSFVHAESFKIDSYYYIDSAPKPNEVGSRVVYNIDTPVSCSGQQTNKIFLSKDSYKFATTPYLLTRFWPSYFLKQAALVNADVEVALGQYDEILEACEVGFNYEGGAIQRWYDPHIFTVSDEDDTNPINKVYYQLYINARSPTFSPWVYADTDYTVTCDGVTTNRVIPSTNPNEYGQVITDEFGSQVDPSYSSENTRSFFDLLGGKIASYTVGRYVPEVDGCIIHNVKFSENNISSEAIKIGQQQCIDDPEICNLFSKDEIDLAVEIGFEDGIQACIDSPESCGLFNQSNLDSSYSNGKSAGVQDCVNDPESCDLFDQQAIDDSLAQGILDGEQNCKDDPATCGLFNQEAIDDSRTQGISEGEQNCKDDPATCGLFNQSDIDNTLAEGKESGIQSCKDKPETCDLFDQADIDEAYIAGEANGKANCIADPASCNLFDQDDVNSIVDDNIADTVEDIANLLPKGVIKKLCKKHEYLLICEYVDVKPKGKGKDKDKKKGKDKAN